MKISTIIICLMLFVGGGYFLFGGNVLSNRDIQEAIEFREGKVKPPRPKAWNPDNQWYLDKKYEERYGKD